MMKLNILFFATLRDIVGVRTLALELNQTTATVQQVKEALITRYPDAEANLKAALCAVNQEFTLANGITQDGDDVAFFPPVSGGDHDPARPEVYHLPTAPIDHDALIASITTPEVGAVVVFSGVVRGKTAKEGHLPQTDYLEYEAYESMAYAKMRQVADEIRARFPMVIGIAMVQRLGKLSVGDNTVLIACSSAHRDNGCFEGAQYGINRLKEIVPVWKKEVSADGTQWIEGDYTPKDGD